ncbi:hypothetical protein K525DRAFT_202687 [Schizophyllum commune Loenen D]|nr:hypothetical protein K525DRAFT_202687 [Schizophyllum commune Loenen D]
MFFDLSCLRKFIVTTAVDLGLYGVQTALFFTAASALARQSHTPQIVQVPIIILFLSSTMAATALILFFCTRLTCEDRYSDEDLDHLHVLTSVLSVADRINYLLSDLVIVWRAWVLWPDSRVARVVLVFCFVTSIAGVGVEVIPTLTSVTSYDSDGPRTPTIAMATPLIATNLISTGLIGARVWYYWRHISKSLGTENKSRIQGVLLLLLESGLVYLGFWLAIYVGLIYDWRSPDSLQLYHYSVFYKALIDSLYNIAGIYPTFVFLVVAAKRSTAETMLTSAQLSKPLNFARNSEASAAEESESIELSGHTDNFEEHGADFDAENTNLMQQHSGPSTSGSGSTRPESDLPGESDRLLLRR